jgi:hypothetical protein
MRLFRVRADRKEKAGFCPNCPICTDATGKRLCQTFKPDPGFIIDLFFHRVMINF